MLVIETIEHCNFKCYFCKAKDLEHIKMMPVELFKSIIDQAADLGIAMIDMIPSKGEPFLHPGIYEMLDHANKKMKEVLIFSNATAINVDKLLKIDMSNIKLCISYYGDTVEKFNELTGMQKNLFNTVHRRIDELRAKNITFNIERRDQNYRFNYKTPEFSGVFDDTQKCAFHQIPKINTDGKITFCKFMADNTSSKAIHYVDLNTTSLKEALEHPLRYKFMDSQSICKNHCNSFSHKCHKTEIAMLKTMSQSKLAYLSDPDTTDKYYSTIEQSIKDASIQRT